MLACQHASNPPKLRTNSHLSDAEIAWILALDHWSLLTCAIASEVAHSQSTIVRIIWTYDYKMFQARDRTWIHKCQTIVYEDRILTRVAKANDDQAYYDIIYLFVIKVSHHTLHRSVKEIDLYSRIRCQKPLLKPAHKAARLRYAK